VWTTLIAPPRNNLTYSLTYLQICMADLCMNYQKVGRCCKWRWWVETISAYRRTRGPCVVGLVWYSATTWRCSAFIKWTEDERCQWLCFHRNSLVFYTRLLPDDYLALTQNCTFSGLPGSHFALPPLASVLEQNTCNTTSFLCAILL